MFKIIIICTKFRKLTKFISILFFSIASVIIMLSDSGSNRISQIDIPKAICIFGAFLKFLQTLESIRLIYVTPVPLIGLKRFVQHVLTLGRDFHACTSVGEELLFICGSWASPNVKKIESLILEANVPRTLLCCFMSY